MTSIRAFRNSDPPAIAEIWRSQPQQRGLAQPMSPAILERCVLAKPYFDRRGFLVAVEEGRPVGFVHAAMGPTPDGSTLDPAFGILALLLVSPVQRREQIADQLLQQAETYLWQSGARWIQAGGSHNLAPFYLGLYGGSGLPGILESDAWTLQIFRARHYEPCLHYVVLQKQLAGYRPPVTRELMQIRRAHNLDADLDPRPESWWDACTAGQTERTRFAMRDKRTGDEVGHLMVWDMEPLASSWGVHAMGITELSTNETEERAFKLFLLTEAMRQLQSQGVTLLEVQLSEESPEMTIYHELGFAEVDRGHVLKRTSAPEPGV